MNEVGKFASPVFKKRFARRKTTHRPFTFAHNFEADPTKLAAGNQIVSQVGDRGLVITSPVRHNDGLSITEIVRQSPVPVLFAHSSPPRDEQKEISDHEENDPLETSHRRRSFRSREPSQEFLNRNQYPVGTPQHVRARHIPDEHYIGSKSESSIDADVSFTEENVPSMHKVKRTSTSSSRKPDRAQVTQSLSTKQPADGKRQGPDTTWSEDHMSDAKDLSARKGSRGKSTVNSKSIREGKQTGGQVSPHDLSIHSSQTKRTTARTLPTRSSTSRRRLNNSAASRMRNRSVSTVSPEGSIDNSSLQKSKSNSKVLPQRIRKNKESTAHAVTDNRTSPQPDAWEIPDKTPQSTHDSEITKDRSVSGHRKKIQNKSEQKSGATSSSKSKGSTNRFQRSVSAKKKSSSDTETFTETGANANLSPVEEIGEKVKKSKGSKETNKVTPRRNAGSKKLVQDETLSSYEMASRMKRVSNEKDYETGLSVAVKSRTSQLQEGQNSDTENQISVKKKEKTTATSNMQQSMKRKAGQRKVTPLKNQSQNKSVGKNSSAYQSVQKSRKLPKRALTEPEHSRERLEFTEIVDARTSPRRSGPKTSDSFWKRSLHVDNRVKPRRQQRRVSQSFVHEDDSVKFGQPQMSSSVTTKRKRRKETAHEKQARVDSSPEREEPKRRKTATELNVIMNMLAEVEEQINEDSEMSQECLTAVHRAFSVTKKQLKQTDNQLMEIRELKNQVNKLKSFCKEMSSEVQENVQQKLILKKELQSKHDEGIDANMMQIDQWLRDFQALQRLSG